jgi:tRNA-splicing ligase RtcB
MIYAEVLEDEALKQYNEALAQPFTLQGALMADAHTGYSLPIGGVILTQEMLVPAWVGYDIGCGMLAIPHNYCIHKYKDSIFKDIYNNIPVGFKHSPSPSHFDEFPNFSGIAMEIYKEKGGGYQLGSLGSGNHFIEISDNWIIIHCGSRGVGHGIASHYMKNCDFALSIFSEEGKNYLKDMETCEEWALLNREIIAKSVIKILHQYSQGKADWSKLVNTTHNHVRRLSHTDAFVHRKGATQANKGQLGIIAGNMRDGSFLVRGKGNEESMCSASHGAGRVLGRRAAKKKLDFDEFEKSMSGILANVSTSTLDEAPLAYKNIYEVMELQKDLVEVVEHIKPVINIKG